MSFFNNKTKEDKKFVYHNSSSTSPSMKVVQHGKDFQAVQVKTQKNMHSFSDLAKTVYTRNGGSAQCVSYDSQGNKTISTDRRTLNGEWEFDTYPENFGVDKKIDFWV